MPCGGGNRVVYNTCPNSGRRVVPQATAPQPVAPKVTTQKVVPAGGSIVYYSSSSGSTNGGTTYRSSSSKSTGGTSYHYESHSSSGGGGPGSKTIVETRSTGLELTPQMHIDSGLSASEIMELMKAEMDSTMLGTEKTTIIRTTGLDGGLTEKSYVERSSMPVTEISSLEEMTSLFSRLSSTQLVVIDFTAHWCGPSKSIAPVFEKLASQYPNARFFKVDVDKAKDVTQKYGVQSMPTFVFLKNKVEVKRIVGADRDALVATITKYYTSPPSNTDATNSLEQQFFKQVTVVSKSMPVTEIFSLKELKSQLSRLSSTQLVIIDFFAHWCGPSKSIAPVYEKLSSQYPNARFFKVDVDKTQDVTQKYGVNSMPTFVFLKNRTEIERTVAPDRDILVRIITKYYTSPPSDLDDTDSLEQQSHQQVTVVSKSTRKNEITIDDSKMSPEMQQDAVTCVTTAIGKYSDDLAIAKYIKVTFDDTYEKYWHCIVGNAASYVSYDDDFYIRFKWGDKKITLFKAPDSSET